MPFQRGVVWRTTRQLRQRSTKPRTPYDAFCGHCDEPRDNGSIFPLPDLIEETNKGIVLPEKASKSKVVKTKKEIDKEKEARAKERWMEIFWAVCDVHWGRIICDAGSYMKSPSAQRHQAIAGLARETTSLLEAAPIRNHLSDISGYLNILSKSIPECKKDEVVASSFRCLQAMKRGKDSRVMLIAISDGLKSAKCHHKTALGFSAHGQ
jgi:hypothetical protein